jgi:hypothetical protein
MVSSLCPVLDVPLLSTCLGRLISSIETQCRWRVIAWTTQPTTYPWDTCGPHAIICALGGDVADARTGEALRYSIANSNAHMVRYLLLALLSLHTCNPRLTICCWVGGGVGTLQNGVVASLSVDVIHQLVNSTADIAAELSASSIDLIA